MTFNVLAIVVEPLIVVVAKVVVPVTVRVEVAVTSPTVRLDTIALVVVELTTVRPVILAIVEYRVPIVPVSALSVLANRFVEVALVVVELTTVRPVISAISANRL